MSAQTRFAALAVAVALSAAAARADDKVENPEFKNWAKYKAGSAVVMKMTNEAGGQKTEATVTNTLLEVKDDKLVVQTEVVTKFNGQEIKTPGQKRDVMKMLDKAPAGFDAKTGKPDGTTDEGKEKVKVGGTEYECKWYKYKTKVKLPTGEEEVESQLWVSDDVPGTAVKMTSKSKLGGMTLEATEVTVKK